MSSLCAPADEENLVGEEEALVEEATATATAVVVLVLLLLLLLLRH